MKKSILIIITTLIVGGVQAQDNAISKYFAKYIDDTAFTKVSVTSKMFSLFTEIDAEDENEKELLEAMSKLKGIKALINEKPANPRALYKEAIAKISGNKDYEELLSVQDAEEDVIFMIRDKGGIINELLMVAGGNKHFMVLSLFGEIDLKKISRLSRVMNIEGMDRLKVLDKDKNNDDN